MFGSSKVLMNERILLDFKNTHDIQYNWRHKQINWLTVDPIMSQSNKIIYNILYFFVYTCIFGTVLKKIKLYCYNIVLLDCCIIILLDCWIVGLSEIKDIFYFILFPFISFVILILVFQSKILSRIQ